MGKIKYILLLFFVAVIAVIIGYQLTTDGSSTLTTDYSDFSISDTASIDKIFIADRRGNQVTLSRDETGVWKVNEQYDVVSNTLENLLETVKLMTVMSPVSKARYDKTIRDLSSVGVKVELYQGSNTPSKVFYVGTPNQTHTGNFMMIEGSNLPYLVHMEGFRGFLSPRFSPFENDWRRKTIFHFSPKQIAEVRVDFPGSLSDGFVINQSIDGELSVSNHAGIPVSDWDKKAVYDYLERFREVNFEMWEETKTPMFIDSVSTSTPLEIYTVKDHVGNEVQVKTLLKPLKSGIDIDGNPIDHDQDRMYALINNSEFVIIQYFVFDPLNYKLSYFNKM